MDADIYSGRVNPTDRPSPNVHEMRLMDVWDDGLSFVLQYSRTQRPSDIGKPFHRLTQRPKKAPLRPKSKRQFIFAIPDFDDAERNSN